MRLLGKLKLYKVKGFFIHDFYLLASSQEQAEKEARKALTFRVEVCPLEEPESREDYGL